MAVFINKPFAEDSLTCIRDNLSVDHWGKGLGALTLDIYSYSYPHENRRFDSDEWDERMLHLTFQDKSSFKQAYQMARSIIRNKG